MKEIILHVCCAPCATHSIEELMKEHSVILFFSNSNIFPKEEYEKRLENAKKIADHYNLVLIEDDYDHKSWLNHIKGLENEPEKGKRCEKCFEFNLNRTAKYADGRLFTTTLTISPHKNSKIIFKIGKNFPNFVDKDFKKQDGFRKSIDISTKLNLYRQSYCGCEFSKGG